MSSKNSVLLVTRDRETEQAVHSAVTDSERLELAGVCRTLQELNSFLGRWHASAVLVDIDPKPRQMLGRLEEITARMNGVRFIVLSNDLQDQLVLEAMQAGARYFMRKSSIAAELANVLQRTMRDAGDREGTLISVHSVSGGCGATTLSVNLANEIKLLSERSTLLVDLDSSYGSVAAYLGLSGEYGIADVLSSTVGIDSDLIRTTALTHAGQFDVLLSPASVNFSRPTPMDYECLQDALQACKAAYDYTVIDAPRLSPDITATLAAESSLAMVVCQLTVKDMRLLRNTLDALAERDVSEEQLLVIATRHRKRGQMISIEELQRVIGDTPLDTITNDYRNATLSINYGKPLSQVAPRSALRRNIENFAIKVSKLHYGHPTSVLSR